MACYYYLTVFPMEALIASELDPDRFGLYMATGPRKGTAEQIMFIEVEGGFGDFFDWDYAQTKCVPHPDGKPKHSVYLGVYRVLENTPLERMKSLYLTTRDGRTMELPRGEYQPRPAETNYSLYQELCPIQPLVVSSLAPREFGEFIISDRNKIVVPALVFTDLKVINFEDPQHTGNIGGIYSRNLIHLKACIDEIVDNPEKPTKTLDRSYTGSFSYQVINRGIYVAAGQDILMYPMADEKTLREQHYDWARSALIL